MNRKTILALGLTMAAAQSCPAAAVPQEALSLSVALALARGHALEVAAADSRLVAARSRWEQARAYRLPVVRLEEMWNYTDSPAEAFAFQLNQERFSFQSFVAGDPNDPDPLDTALTRLEVSLPVYTGGELSGRVEQARLAAEAAQGQRERTADAAAVAAAEAYVRLAQAREQAALLEASRETLARHVEMARAYAGQGMIVRSELLRAEVELARLDDLLAEAGGRARLAETDLSFRLGADLAAVWTLAPLPAEVADPGALEAWLAQAGARADLAAMRQMVAAGQLEEEVRRAAARPRVGLVVRHDLYDGLPAGAHGDSTTVMAMAGVDLWNGGRHRAAAAAARAEADAAARDVERMERGIRLEVQQAWQAMDTARSRQRTAVRSLEAAREAERILGERFRSGVSRMIDLLDAATARREAETRELVARAESRAAAFRLAFAAGKPPESALPPEAPEAPEEGAAR